jgi:hypothetical protein
MKRLSFFVFISVILSLFGCMTYRTFDKTETRQLSQEQVFKKVSATAQFSVINDTNGSFINLNYAESFDAFTVTKYGSFKIYYRQGGYVVNRWGDFHASGDAQVLDEKKIREWDIETLTKKNAKSEQHVISKGQIITLTIPSGQAWSFTLEQDGILPLDEVAVSQILSIIDSLNNLTAISVSSSELGLNKTIDLSSVPAFKAVINSCNDFKGSLAAYKVSSDDSVSQYDKAQKSLIALAASSNYGYQKRMVKEVFDLNYETIAKALESQIYTLQVSIPTFIIQGEIQNFGQASIQVWGTAIPRPLMAQTMRSEGYQYRNSNLIVENPDESGIYGINYISLTHYYLAKEWGLNALGALVPVYRYTTIMPESLKPIDAKVKDLQARLNAINQTYEKDSTRFLSR